MRARVTTAIGRLRSAVSAVRRDESASVSMEYGLVGTLISVAILAGLSSTTTGIGAKWNDVANLILAVLR